MAEGKFTVKEPQAPEPIPVGVYPAKFTGWEHKEEGKYGSYVLLEFEINSGEQEGTKRSLAASAKLTKGKTPDTSSKLFRIVTALLGREPSPSEEVDLEELVETNCQILVEDRPGDEQGWQDISKVMPAKK